MTNVSMSMPTRRVEMRYWDGAAAAGHRGLPHYPRHSGIRRTDLPRDRRVLRGRDRVVRRAVHGRLPDFAHTDPSGLIRWEIRVDVYVLLLTDQYPPFSLEDEEYPVRPILPAPGPLNRLSALFRIILGIPAAVFARSSPTG